MGRATATLWDREAGTRVSKVSTDTGTTLPFKWIAARVQIDTAKGAKSVLRHLAQSQDQRQVESVLEPCAQLEFQSTDPFPVGLPPGGTSLLAYDGRFSDTSAGLRGRRRGRTGIYQ
jgi:hypothetical protein